MDTSASIQETIDNLTETVEQLEAENNELRERIDRNQSAIDTIRPSLYGLGQYRDRLAEDENRKCEHGAAWGACRIPGCNSHAYDAETGEYLGTRR
jgi:predicted nuclease with TOPRIM domain